MLCQFNEKVWYYSKNETEFNEAEIKRKKLIKSKKIGPEFSEKYHSDAIYTSGPLSTLISKCLSTNSSTISFSNEQDYNYISEEQELDIDIESSSRNLSIQNSLNYLKKRSIEELNLEIHGNSVGKRIKTSEIHHKS
ncbi:kinase-like domain-containing protein [Rhizophagus clarus]|uniref:Kinase-like domain-containing protein n=1 Tax=Rhizophagus clarus TaxID=94130 RepID=A0A8H3LAY9_9GLOM|nr:kinase-like domain-containing protein [Rhizophagus clarus]